MLKILKANLNPDGSLILNPSGVVDISVNYQKNPQDGSMSASISYGGMFVGHITMSQSTGMLISVMLPDTLDSEVHRRNLELIAPHVF